MASGDPLFVFEMSGNTPPSADFARIDYIVADDGLREVLDFIGSGGSVDESGYLSSAWPKQYSGGGVDIVLHYSTDGSSVGVVQFEVSIETTKDGDDLGVGGVSFGTITDITDTPSTSTADFLDITAAGNISHVNCGSPVQKQGFRLKVTRDHDHATNTDDAQLEKIIVNEA